MKRSQRERESMKMVYEFMNDENAEPRDKLLKLFAVAASKMTGEKKQLKKDGFASCRSTNSSLNII